MGEHADMKNSRLLFTARSGLSLAILSLAACAFADESSAPPAPAASLMAPIKTLIGDAECDHPDQCHAVGIGAKACGGPGGYLAWSVKNTDQAALMAAVNAQVQAQKAANRTGGLMSDCSIVMAPTATCRPRASDGKKTCQLGQGGVRGLD